MSCPNDVKGDDGWQEAFPSSLTLQALFQLSVNRRRYHEMAAIRATMSFNISCDTGHIWPLGKATAVRLDVVERGPAYRIASLYRFCEILHLYQDMRRRRRMILVLQRLRTQGGYKPTTNTFLLSCGYSDHSVPLSL